MPLRLDKDGPAGAEPTQGVVQAAGDADQFGRHRAVEIRPPKLCRALKRAILVEDDALVDQSGPGQEIRETAYVDRRYSARFIMRDLRR